MKLGIEKKSFKFGFVTLLFIKDGNIIGDSKYSINDTCEEKFGISGFFFNLYKERYNTELPKELFYENKHKLKPITNDITEKEAKDYIKEALTFIEYLHDEASKETFKYEIEIKGWEV
jgi:hypothetical protein